MNDLPFNIGAYLGAHHLLRRQIDLAAKQILYLELRVEKPSPVRRTIKMNQNIHVAVLPGFVAREGAENGEFGDAEALREDPLVRPENFQDFIPLHRCSRGFMKQCNFSCFFSYFIVFEKKAVHKFAKLPPSGEKRAFALDTRRFRP